MIQNPVAPHCQGAMPKVVPAGSEQMLLILFELLVVTSAAQLPFFYNAPPKKIKKIINIRSTDEKSTHNIPKHTPHRIYNLPLIPLYIDKLDYYYHHLLLLRDRRRRDVENDSCV